MTNETIKVFAEGFDAVRFLEHGANAECHLLELDVETNGYKEIFSFRDGWSFKYNESTVAYELEAAVDSADFDAAVKRASHAAVNSDVYEIHQGAIQAGNLARPVWKFKLDRTGERFE